MKTTTSKASIWLGGAMLAATVACGDAGLDNDQAPVEKTGVTRQALVTGTMALRAAVHSRAAGGGVSPALHNELKSHLSGIHGAQIGAWLADMLRYGAIVARDQVGAYCQPGMGNPPGGCRAGAYLFEYTLPAGLFANCTGLFGYAGYMCGMMNTNTERAWFDAISTAARSTFIGQVPTVLVEKTGNVIRAWWDPTVKVVSGASGSVYNQVSGTRGKNQQYEPIYLENCSASAAAPVTFEAMAANGTTARTGEDIEEDVECDDGPHTLIGKATSNSNSNPANTFTVNYTQLL